MKVPKDSSYLLLAKAWRYKDDDKVKQYIADARQLGYKSIGEFNFFLKLLSLLTPNLP